MDQNIVNSINARKEAFTNAYIIEDQKILKKIDDLFNQINDFGSKCSDVLDFETKFQSSPLNQEYINLFTTIVTTCKPVAFESNNEVKSNSEYLKDEVVSDLKYAADELARPIRRNIKQKIYDKARDIPGVSEVMMAKQYSDLADKYTNKRGNDNDND